MVRRLVLVVAVAAGCRVSEQISPPPGQPSVIAQMILNTASPVQFLQLERSDGASNRTWLTGATVQLTHLSPDASCTQPVVTLHEMVDTTIYGLTTTITQSYQTAELCALHTGDRVALRIETPQGDVVTGTTRIPGATDLAVSAGLGQPPVSGDSFPIDRTRDSMRVTMVPQFARGLQIEVLRKGGNPRRTRSGNPPTSPAFDITTDTTHAAIAGDLVDPFEARTIFHAGVAYLLAVAPADTNYFDFVRSGDNPLTGRGFINHLTGGIGVFGSVSPRILEMPVRAPQEDPREGMYRLTGSLAAMGGVSVDVTWDLYLDQLGDQENFSALMDGTWVEGETHSSVDGRLDTGFHAQFYGTPTVARPDVRTLYEVDYDGQLPPLGVPFVAKLTSVLPDRSLTDQVTVVQVSGPR